MSAALKLVPIFELVAPREWGSADISLMSPFDFLQFPGATGPADPLVGSTLRDWREDVAIEPGPSYQTSLNIYSLSNPVATSPLTGLSAIPAAVQLLSGLGETDDDQDDSAIPDEGTYAPPWPRKVLWSEVVEFRISELPRRKPCIAADDGFLAVLDDE